MTPAERNHLVSLRMEQAVATIAEAEQCIAQELLPAATNRIYYGMFYAMLALGILKGFETSKHQQMIGWFNKQFVHTGIFPKQFGRMAKDAFEVRMDSDYKVKLTPTPEQLEALLADMKLFIRTIKTWVENNPA
ncbi:MAG: HEPN domain-containing protein [Saprospiraceae bacterium]|jgi:hypothetical protein|nr:HEPN domain-containing protein [Saprospiraceae bacterium]